ncbi:MAG: class I SAM-dependent methyltransferase [Pseudomonadota bacterium]
MSNSTASHDHWSDYWSSGALTSLPQDFAANYDGEVAEFWNTRFSELDEKVSVLDVCTGNGPIALLAARYARDHGASWSIDAVDAARPDPMVIAQRIGADAELLERIRFQGETAIELLPFETDAFDLITSQYGLEYADLEQAAGELARVLSPGGTLVFVHHAADSEMIRTMAAEAEDYRTLSETGLLKMVRSWANGQLADPDFSKRLESPLRRLMQQARRPGASPLLVQVAQSFGSLLQMPMNLRRQQKSAAAEFARQLSSGQSRLEDMLRVNRMVAGSEDWTKPFEKAGLKRTDQGEMIYRGQHQMGGYQIWSR